MYWVLYWNVKLLIKNEEADLVGKALNISTWKTEAGGCLRVQGEPGLYNEFQGSLGFIERPGLQKGEETEEEEEEEGKERN